MIIPWSRMIIPWSRIIIPWSCIIIPWSCIIIPWSRMIIHEYENTSHHVTYSIILHISIKYLSIDRSIDQSINQSVTIYVFILNKGKESSYDRWNRSGGQSYCTSQWNCSGEVCISVLYKLTWKIILFTWKVDTFEKLGSERHEDSSYIRPALRGTKFAHLEQQSMVTAAATSSSRAWVHAVYDRLQPTADWLTDSRQQTVVVAELPTHHHVQAMTL